MKSKFLLLLGILLLITNAQAIDPGDLESGKKHLSSSLPPLKACLSSSDVLTITIDDTPPPTRVLARLPSSESSPSQTPPLSKWHRFLAWGGHISGNILTILGIPVAATGGVLVASYPDISSFEGQIGIGLAALGAIMDRSGNLLLENSRREAAELERMLNKHARKASRSVELSLEEIEALSGSFFAASETYKDYIGCASKANRLISRLFKVIGPAAVLTGGGFTFMDEKPIGPILTVAGAAVSTVGEALKKRADAHDAQLKRIEEVNQARAKARTSRLELPVPAAR